MNSNRKTRQSLIDKPRKADGIDHIQDKSPCNNVVKSPNKKISSPKVYSENEVLSMIQNNTLSDFESSDDDEEWVVTKRNLTNSPEFLFNSPNTKGKLSKNKY